MIEQLDKLKDSLAQLVADLLPGRVVYWVLIKVGIEHCGGPNHPTEIVPQVPYTTVLQRVERPNAEQRVLRGHR